MISLKERFPQLYCLVVRIEVAVASTHAQGQGEEEHSLDDNKVEVVVVEVVESREGRGSIDSKDEGVVVAESMQRDFQLLTQFINYFFIFF